jgi:adenosine deaminase
VVPDLAAHPIDRMLAAGLHATINSDDPAYFGGYVNDNYRAVAGALGREALAVLARNSFEGSFLGEAEKAAQIERLDAYLAASKPSP